MSTAVEDMLCDSFYYKWKHVKPEQGILKQFFSTKNMQGCWFFELTRVRFVGRFMVRHIKNEKKRCHSD